jgi:DNA-binding SARP family transcriptional activator/tetratricopeptide (TPR) repeat protein
MDFLVLGPLVASDQGRALDLGSRRRERCLLGLLLLEPGRAISVNRLIDLLWEGVPPADARRTLSSHVSRLRGLLDPDRSGRDGVRLRNRGDGYLVEVLPDCVDAHRFRGLVERALQLPDPAERSRLLGDALALWRGPLLADVATEWLRQRIGTALAELRLSAIEAKLEADLACGRHVAAVAEAARVVGEHPFRERLTGLYMLALYRCGQHADALAQYRTVRGRLVEELGLDPGPELSAMHEAILRRDPALDPPGHTTGLAPSPNGPYPAQLPAPPRSFAGRDRELRELDALLDAAEGRAVAAIVGPAGVGKTALALQWAANARDRFPDGQLYLNLRGYLAGEPVTPVDALGQLLRGLGVPADRVPVDVEEAAAAYRTLLAYRRMLVVLDDAYGVDQLRSLLPGTSTCAVLVTSRNRLTGLVVMDGAGRLALEPLAVEEAVALLRSVLGVARVAAEPVAAAELVDVCDGLPLALRISAANLYDHPDTTVEDLVRELRSGRLARLSVEDDPNSAVGTVLDASYGRLSPTARRVFRLLPLSPGPDVGLATVAALADTLTSDAGDTLAALVETHLVEEPLPGRYVMHDLVRAYAAERLDGDEPAEQRDAAVRRLVEWYVAVAEAVYRVAISHREPLKLTSRRRPAEQSVAPDRNAALAFLDGERAGLAAATRLALDSGETELAWQLAHLLSGYFQLRGDGPDSLAVYEYGLAAAWRVRNDVAAAALHNSAGVANLILYRWQAALEDLGRARDLSRLIGDRDGEARALVNLARALDELGRFDEAVTTARRAIRLSRALGQQMRVGRAWNNMAYLHLRHGMLARALAYANRSLRIHREMGDRNGEAIVLDTLGLIHLAEGDQEAALARLQEALVALREAGNRAKEGDTLANVATAYQAGGDFAAAVEHFDLAARRHHLQGDLHRESVVRRQLGETYLATGDLDAATAELAAALALRSQVPDAAEEARLRQLLSDLRRPVRVATTG